MPKPTIPLTKRETEVVRWAAKGYTTRTTASELGIGLETVKEHRATAMRKLGVDSIAAAVSECMRLRILEAIG